MLGFLGGVGEESMTDEICADPLFCPLDLFLATGSNKLGKNTGQSIAGIALMWLMPLRSLSNCDYELNFYLRLILGPIHSNQVMGTDPVGSYHGTRNSRSNSVNPTYRYQSHD